MIAYVLFVPWIFFGCFVSLSMWFCDNSGGPNGFMSLLVLKKGGGYGSATEQFLCQENPARCGAPKEWPNSPEAS